MYRVVTISRESSRAMRQRRMGAVEAPKIPDARPVEEGFLKVFRVGRIVARRNVAQRGPEQRLRGLAHLPRVPQITIDDPMNTFERGILRPRELDHVDSDLDLADGLIDLVDHCAIALMPSRGPHRCN